MEKKLKQSKLSTEPYKGVRDFYPEEMAVQNYIFDVMRKTVESFGYSEYGASVLEPSDLYKAKSGEEIVNEQTYTFIDRGEREVSLRPEMTPTVARMIAGKLKSISLPLRWYSIPNLFRYEKPQRGRVREHWQLNVDIFGVKTLDAEVEVISMAAKIMENFGFKESDFEIRINNRKIIDYILNDLYKLTPEVSKKVTRLIDKRSKIMKEEFEKGIKEFIPKGTNEFLEILNSKNFEEFFTKLKTDAEASQAITQIKDLLEQLENLGITNVVFAQDLMRGFDYYTGVVFEIFDKSPENNRAVFGGGRYDDLLSIFGKETVPSVGFGMGDVVIKDMLETYNLLPKIAPAAKLCLCVMDEKLIPYAQDLAQKTRGAGISTIVDYSGKKVGDQIKYADKNKIPFIICVGDLEKKTGKLKVKELSTGKEIEVAEDGISSIIR